MDTKRQHAGENREAGSIVVFSALVMVVLAALATLAVDYGFLQYKRSQLQTAADTAALSGAAGLLRYGDNLTEVRETAVDFGQRNLGEQDMVASAVTTDDVAFFTGDQPAAATRPDTVKVTTGRTTVRGNPVDMFLGPILGWDTQDLTATASASLFCSKQTKCLKPWSPPDTTIGDIGTPITLMIGDPKDTPMPGVFQAVAYPPVGAGNIEAGVHYRYNIAGCSGPHNSNNTVVKIGDELMVEPGRMVGQTKLGMEDLMATDPGASWDSATNSIVGSAYSDPMQSPRVALIPFYVPESLEKSGRTSIVVSQIGAVFVESINAAKGEVTGRFIRAMAVDPKRADGSCDTDAVALYGVGLVK